MTSQTSSAKEWILHFDLKKRIKELEEENKFLASLVKKEFLKFKEQEATK